MPIHHPKGATRMREDIKHTIDLSIFPTELAEVIALHASMFGNTRMEADGTDGDDGTGGQTASQEAKSTFQPPATQEEMDRIITARLSRERAKYADYDELKTKAGKFDAAEQANMSDLQKATERAEKAEQALAAAQVAVLRSEVASAKGLPAELAARLQGATKAELEADADALAAIVGQSKNGKPGGAPVPSQGTGRPDLNTHGYESGAERARRKFTPQAKS